MRIGLDLSCWSNQRGYGRYTRELVRAMVSAAPTDEFVGFLDEPSVAGLDVEAPNLELIPVRQSAAPTRAAAANGSRSPIDLLRFTRAVWRRPVEVFFSPSVYTYFPMPPRRCTVVAVHDAIADEFPELTLPSRRARLFWTAKVRLALAQARLVITVSEFAADALVRVLGVPRSRIRVTNEAPAPDYRPSRAAEVSAAAGRAGLPTDARWFVYVGGFNPHKHVDTIVRAHARLARTLGAAAPYLLLVGTTTDDVFHGALESIREAITDGGTESLVRWTGFVPDVELRHLHSGALALLLPSQCEGFGLPAVEAAACGAPVIATTASPLPALLEGGGIFVAPGDVNAIEEAMRFLTSDRDVRRRLGERALARARELTWDRSARRALDALHEAAQA